MEMRWGWKVPWDKKPLVNARSETIAQLAAFKPHLQNRCLILADGFYEKGIRFIQPGEPVFCMAGLWCEEEIRWGEAPDEPNTNGGRPQGQARGDARPTIATPAQSNTILSASTGERIKGEVSKQFNYVLLTTTPNDSVKPYHDRMPLIVRPEFYDAWLGNDWQTVLENPDKGPLEKHQKQPELF